MAHVLEIARNRTKLRRFVARRRQAKKRRSRHEKRGRRAAARQLDSLDSPRCNHAKGNEGRHRDHGCEENRPSAAAERGQVRPAPPPELEAARADGVGERGVRVNNLSEVVEGQALLDAHLCLSVHTICLLITV